MVSELLETLEPVASMVEPSTFSFESVCLVLIVFTLASIAGARLLKV